MESFIFLYSLVNSSSIPFLQLAGDVLGKGISSIFIFGQIYFLYSWCAFVPVVKIVLIFEFFNIGFKLFGITFLMDASLDEDISHSFTTSNKAI